MDRYKSYKRKNLRRIGNYGYILIITIVYVVVILINIGLLRNYHLHTLSKDSKIIANGLADSINLAINTSMIIHENTERELELIAGLLEDYENTPNLRYELDEIAKTFSLDSLALYNNFGVLKACSTNKGTNSFEKLDNKIVKFVLQNKKYDIYTEPIEAAEFNQIEKIVYYKLDNNTALKIEYKGYAAIEHYRKITIQEVIEKVAVDEGLIIEYIDNNNEIIASTISSKNANDNLLELTEGLETISRLLIYLMVLLLVMMF